MVERSAINGSAGGSSDFRISSLRWTLAMGRKVTWSGEPLNGRLAPCTARRTGAAFGKTREHAPRQASAGALRVERRAHSEAHEHECRPERSEGSALPGPNP